MKTSCPPAENINKTPALVRLLKENFNLYRSPIKRQEFCLCFIIEYRIFRFYDDG